ncbi:hypothetical protein U6N30_18735 [Blastococcus brunescens]|uniref:Uncharacterized protein n=1 Tax=Blastococcus brunescens TaxID=1564165 RepID=A0ABZ1AU26_9ACTN|nr:hypothetical protein [Blastococcus sp. BMG 8361]WRL62083.1 hypothetical protein U6N30_18735 [Blastococcus sp. BMG 8361]
MPCSIASRVSSSRAISSGSRPKMRRRSSRTTRTDPSAPTSAAPPSQATRTGASRSNSAASSRSRMPTETAPITLPSAPRTGTLARSDSPRVPVSVPTNTSPASVVLGSVDTRSPMRSGSGWERRIPSRSVMTTKVTAEAFRMSSARGCSVWLGSAVP